MSLPVSLSQVVADQTYDLVVIGGGINGAGVVRDAALRGLKTLLVEKDDFGGGTTSWSTRLIHGGLRYLEYFEFALVRESLHEREVLLNNAPHLVKPLLLTIPIYGYGSRQYWEIQAGMILYDILSYDRSMPAHRMLSVKKLKQLFRHLNPQAVKGAAQYYDAQAELAERLCLETVQAAAAAGATVLNHTAVTEIVRTGDRLTQITLQDQLTHDSVKVPLAPHTQVVNTSGPWVDRVCGLGKRDASDREQAEQTTSAAPLSQKRLIGGTKGSHIIVETFAGAPNTALYVEAKKDNRPFFIVPWRGLLLIGTTDFPYQGPLDQIKAGDDEIDYLLAETNQVVPTAQLTRADVRFTYSGVRPLPYSEGKSAGSISRSHLLHDHQKDGVSNLISLVGGKLTTHRNSSEEIVDAVYKKLGRPAPPCRTAHEPLPGAILPNDPLITALRRDYGDQLPVATLDYLVEIYGSRAKDVLALTDQAPELSEPIVAGRPDIKAQVLYAVEAEYARTLVDITRRRTDLAIQTHYGEEALPAMVEVLTRYGGWSQAEGDRQIQAHQAYMAANCIPDFALEDHQTSQRVAAQKVSAQKV